MSVSDHTAYRAADSINIAAVFVYGDAWASLRPARNHRQSERSILGDGNRPRALSIILLKRISRAEMNAVAEMFNVTDRATHGTENFKAYAEYIVSLKLINANIAHPVP